MIEAQSYTFESHYQAYSPVEYLWHSQLCHKCSVIITLPSKLLAPALKRSFRVRVPISSTEFHIAAFLFVYPFQLLLPKL